MPKHTAIAPYQSLDVPGSMWRICSVKFSGVARHTDAFMPAPGDTSGRRTAAVTLLHRGTGQQITAGFVWNGCEWFCPARNLRVGADAMIETVGRGFGGSR